MRTIKRATDAKTTVRRRLLLTLLVPLALLLSVGVLVDFFNSTRTVRAAYDQGLANETVAVAELLRLDAGGAIKSDLPPQAVAVLRADNYDLIFYLVLGPHGEFIAGDDGLPVADPPLEQTVYHEARYRDHPIRAATYRTRTDAGVVTITVAETLHKRENATRRIFTGALFTDLLQMSASLMLIWFGVRYGLRPLLALRDQIAARPARELAPLDERGVPDEVIPLTSAVNRLLAAVREATLAQQQFLADAAHQLRTPLTGIQAQLELLARDPAAGELRERLHNLHNGCRRLAHTANQLLALARAEPSANLADDFRAVELQGLVEEAVAGNLDRALECRIDLGAETAPARVHGVAWLLRELLANLVDNALTYTPANGHVTVRCGIVENESTSEPFLEVEDNGPGIAESERARVIERFYRLPASGGSGCGLGLAIVDDIAHVHGASLEIAAGAGDRGTRVRVRFPAHAAARRVP
ncbi:MAG: sensor histidine kinase N-terminal domain-containing protein [Rudaea sp.]|nr:sensor histidine kinase N-terminal domain-containing protein [Rudaea sp.]